MERLTPVGRIFFALALIGLGIEHFVFNDFITGRAPAWPPAIPGRVVWAYLTGSVFVVIGLAILVAKHARPLAVLAAVLIASWALLRNLPVVAAASLLSSAWTLTGKALMLTGGALAMAAISPAVATASDGALARLVNQRRPFIMLARWCLGSFFVLTGIQHFLFTTFVASLIPRWFPGNAIFWTYFAGVALIAGGIGLFLPFVSRLAALLSGVMVFSWFWIVHLPRTFLSISDGIAIFEALAVSGIAFVLAGCGPDLRARQPKHDEA